MKNNHKAKLTLVLHDLQVQGKKRRVNVLVHAVNFFL